MSFSIFCSVTTCKRNGPNWDLSHLIYKLYILCIITGIFAFIYISLICLMSLSKATYNWDDIQLSSWGLSVICTWVQQLGFKLIIPLGFQSVAQCPKYSCCISRDKFRDLKYQWLQGWQLKIYIFHSLITCCFFCLYSLLAKPWLSQHCMRFRQVQGF